MSTLLATALVSAFFAPSGTLIVDFKVPIEEGWVVNEKGPWALELHEVRDMEVDTIDFKPKLPGFAVETRNKPVLVSFDYEVRAYFCRQDFSVCKTQTFTGSASLP